MPPNSVDLNRMSTGNAPITRLLGLGVFLSSEMPHSISVNWQFPLVWMLYFCAMAGMYDLIPHFSSFQKTGQSAPRRLHFPVCTPLLVMGCWNTWGDPSAPQPSYLSVAVPDEVLRGGWKPGAPSTVMAAWPGQTKASEHPHRPLRLGSPLWPGSQLCPGSSFLSSSEKRRRCIW